MQMDPLTASTDGGAAVASSVAAAVDVVGASPCETGSKDGASEALAVAPTLLMRMYASNAASQAVSLTVSASFDGSCCGSEIASATLVAPLATR